MILHLEDIKEQGLFLEFEEPVSAFPVLQEMAQGDLEFTSPVAASLKAIRIAEMVEVEGRVQTTLRGPCGRCLQAFEIPLAAHFSLTFTRELPEVADEEDEEIELSADDLGLIPFEGEKIDLRPFLQEQVIMAIPLHPLCRENCKGLCPHCGSDLNEVECGCVRPVFNSRFAALKNLKVEGGEEKK